MNWKRLCVSELEVKCSKRCLLSSTNRKSGSASKAPTMSENVSIFKAYVQNECVQRIRQGNELIEWRDFHFFFFLFIGLHLGHMEDRRLGVESELQPPAYTRATATGDPSRVCDLCYSLRQRWILDPLSKARNRIRNLMVPSQICFHCATMGTPGFSLLINLVQVSWKELNTLNGLPSVCRALELYPPNIFSLVFPIISQPPQDWQIWPYQLHLIPEEFKTQVLPG